ncbi:IucA/IucC family protein [Desulfogranum mediterraneum]|uniref:IucA/IucC family protein n=1 Tax=Desulfogranum mediterraneum TaxID=160661 RepID=UPI000407E8DD|nr:IucA/IucC family protein [Desulfogranum mediterraneum]
MNSSLVYRDRYCNQGTRTYSIHADYTEAAPRYQPQSELASFALTPWAVPRELVRIYTANPPAELLQHYLGPDRVLFCVHPQVLESLPDDPYLLSLQRRGTAAPAITVAPSSSTRTLYVLDQEPGFHALKVHFPFRVSRYGRKMRDEVVEQAIAVSLELEQAIDRFEPGFAFLREVIGISHRSLDRSDNRGENWGYLVREMSPFPLVDGPRELIPGFALYGENSLDPDQAPLLFELIGEEKPLGYILERIMFPLIRHWVNCFRSCGFMLEPHGQNILLELDGAGRIQRLVHRDLSVGIDMRLRRLQGLSSAHLNQYNRMENGAFNSITYDMFMGHHFFERLVSCCRQRHPRLSLAAFQTPCRELFAQIFPEHRDFLPPTIHYFSEQRDQFNKPLYQDTGTPPRWRP